MSPDTQNNPTMHPECAKQFGEIKARIDVLNAVDRDHRTDEKALAELVNLHRESMLSELGRIREDIATLKQQASQWGALSGGLASVVISVITALVLTVVL